MTSLDVVLAGTIALRRGQRAFEDTDLPGRQLRLVLAMLVLERENPVTADRMGGELWPERLPDQWRPALRGLVSKVRRPLVELGLPPEAIHGTGGAYQVALGPVRVDVEDAMRWSVEARDALARDRLVEARDLANRARAVLSRPILPGTDSVWLDDVRSVAEEHLVDVLVVLGTTRSRLGHPSEARTALTEATHRAPLREDAWRALLRAEAAAHNAAGALDAYERCRHILSEELGVDPSAATQQVHAEVLADIPRPDTTPPTPNRPPDTPPRPTLDTEEHTCPYVGLRAFGRHDHDLFFGRSAEVHQVISGLHRDGIAIVVGPSGAGKSSVVRAGVLPALARGAIPDADTWPSLVIMPGTEPFEVLARGLAGLGGDLDEHQVHDRLIDDPDGLHDVADLVLADHGRQRRLVLVVDQFEEVFTLVDEPSARAFVAQLASAARRRDGRVVVVATLRADFVDAAARVDGMARLLSTSTWVLPPLAGEQVEEAVVEPARRAGLSLERGLLARILTDVAGQPGGLPLLQHLLRELWHRRVDGVLTLAAYDDLGGVAGALAHHAERTWVRLAEPHRAVARRLLLRAVHPGEDGATTRRPVPRREWAARDDDPAIVAFVVGRLVRARLLVASRPDPPGHAGDDEPARTRVVEPVVELAHEALIDGWPRLGGWVDRARGWLLVHRRLTRSAVEWDGQDRHDDLLLDGLPLDEAHELLVANQDGRVDLHLSASEHDLLTASLVARDVRRATDAERRTREHRLERRSLQRTRALVAVVAVVAMAAGGLWWSSRRDARVSEIRRLVAASGDAVDDDGQLALLLGLRAGDLAGTGGTALHHDVVDALRRAVRANTRVGVPNDLGDVLAVSADRRSYASTRPAPEDDGTWTVDVRSSDGDQVTATLAGHPGEQPPPAADFGSGDEHLAVASADGSLTVWNIDHGSASVHLPTRRTEGLAAWLDLDPTGTHVAVTADWPPPIRVWDLGDTGVAWTAGGGNEFSNTDGLTGALPRARFHPEEPLVAVMGRDLVRVRRQDGGGQVWSTDIPRVTSIAWSPDGRWLAAAGTGLAVMDARTGEVAIDVPRLDEAAGHVSWQADGTRVATSPGLSGPPGRVRVWRVVEAGRPVRPTPPPVVLDGPASTCRVAEFAHDEVLWERTPCGGDVVRRNLDADGAETIATTTQVNDGWPDPQDVAFRPVGTLLATNTDGRDLVLWSTSSWKPRHELPANRGVDWEPPPDVEALDWTPDGSHLAVRGAYETDIWAMAGPERVATVPSNGSSTVALAPDGKHVATPQLNAIVDDPAADQADEVVVAWDLRGERAGSLRWGANLWSSPGMAFSPDGRFLAAALADRRGLDNDDEGVVVWDWQREHPVLVIEAGATPTGVAWAPSGARLVVATSRPANRLEVWNMSDPLAEADRGGSDTVTMEGTQRVGVLEGHTDEVVDLDLDGSGRLAVSCSADGTARLWDLETGRPLQVITTDRVDPGCRVSIAPGGDLVAVSTPDEDVRVFPTDLASVVEQAEAVLIRTLTPEECRTHDLACPS